MHLLRQEDISLIQKMSLQKEAEAIKTLQKDGWEILLKNTLVGKNVVIASWSPAYDPIIAAINLACQKLGADHLVFALDAYSPDHGRELGVVVGMAELADCLIVHHYNGAFAEKLVEIMKQKPESSTHIVKTSVFDSADNGLRNIGSVMALLKNILAPQIFLNDLVDEYLNARVFAQCVSCWCVETTFGWGDRPQKDLFNLSKVICPRCSPLKEQADKQLRLFSAE